MRKTFSKFLSAVMTAAIVISGVGMNNVPVYAAASESFTNYGGWNEMLFAEISGVKDADVTAVSYSGTMSGSLTGQDFEYLVRDTSNGVRVDIPGVKAGTYTLTVTTKSGTYTASNIAVNAQDRSGFAHYNYSAGVGAYNDDGTLKNDAIVLYVTDANKNTVELSYGGVTVKGIGNILNSVAKECGEAGHEGQYKKISDGKAVYGKANSNQGILQLLAENNIPLDIRMVGIVSDSGLYTPGTWAAGSASLIDGLTVFNSNDVGGSTGDNGHMARMKSAKDVTIEGIGTDAALDGWGIHFMAETATTAKGFGKSFEVRNLTFMNQPEDAVGMEGIQEGSKITAPVERCWIHNNEFYSPSISGPAESDKGEGDGSCDFKRGYYLTVSYNYFEGCHKTNLVGSSDSSLQFHLTYHHNIWKNCDSRMPLGRQADMHWYNNQFIGSTSYTMNTRATAYIFSEYNMFYLCKSPMQVDSGAIKSYNDSFTSYINDMGGTIVTDKNAKVTSGNQFENFDTNASLSYIPSGNYQLQENITEAAKVLKAYNGVMPSVVKTPAEVTMADISKLDYIKKSNTVNVNNVTAVPFTATPGKIESKAAYAFKVGAAVDVTVSYASEALSATGVLCNEAGEAFLVGSGTARNLPAGTYIIQCYNFQSGSNGVNPTAGTFKGFTINSVEITANDPNAHYHDYVSAETKEATCTTEGLRTYTCKTCDEGTEGHAYTEVIPVKAHSFGAWVTKTDATETENGVKERTCSGCGKIETGTIPAKGSNPGVVGGDYEHNFTASELTSTVYKFTGSTSDSKGTVSYGGLTLTKCLKMESATKIEFTAPAAGTLTLVFGGTTAAAGKKVEVNGSSVTCDVNGIATVEIDKAGTVTIAKVDSINLFYMNFEMAAAPATTEVPATTQAPVATTQAPVATTQTPVATTQTPATSEVPATTVVPTTQAPAETVLINYDSASAVTAGITLAGTTAMGTANISTNSVKKNAIQLKNGYTVNDVVTNYIKLETTGGFKAGDVVTVAGFFNNSDDTKDARVCMFEVNGTAAAEPYFTSEKFINGRTSNAAIVEQSYTLTKDMDAIYIGRVGNTTANVTLIKVTRGGAPAATTQAPATTEVPTTTQTPVTPSEVPVEAKNGLVFEDNMWKYYVNNAVDTSYTGLVFYVDTYFYVTNGAVDFGYTGLAAYDGFLFTVTNGVLDTSYNTLVFYNGEWYNVINGFVDPNFTSLVYFGDAWFYVKNGKVDFSYTGLVEFGSAWFYINNGILDWSYTGLAELDGYLFNVKDGILDLSLSGVNNFNGTWYYLENGVVAKWYTSLAQYDGIWFYVNAGVLDFSYTGLVNFNGIWFYVTNGVLDTYYTGLTCYGGAWFYVTGGQLDWNYTGTCMYDGYNFAVVGGMVTGLA